MSRLGAVRAPAVRDWKEEEEEEEVEAEVVVAGKVG